MPESCGFARRLRRFLGSVVIALLPLALISCDKPEASLPPPKPPAVTVAKPLVKELVEWDEFTGRFEAPDMLEVRARVSGYLQSVHFKDGVLVKAGDRLFTIDPRPYQATVDQADANIKSIVARLELARLDLDRADRLTKSGAGTERTLDERRQQYQSLQAELAGAKAVLDQAKLDLDFTEIRTPIGGRISRKAVSEGNLVQANSTLLTTIVSLDPIYFYFDVDERSYLAYSRMAYDGQRPSGRTNAFEVWVALTDEREATHMGKMDFVDNRIDPATGTMRGRAVLENQNLFLTPGLFGRVRIPGSGSYKGVLIPEDAIGADLDRRFVYVVAEDGSVSQRVVRIGPHHDGYRIIRQGLTGDEAVVINGLQRVRPGVKVTARLATLAPTR